MKEVFIRWLYPRARFKVFMLISVTGPEYWMARTSREAALAAGEFHVTLFDYNRFIEISDLSMKCLKFERDDGSLISFEKHFQMVEKRTCLFAMEE